MTTEMTIVDDNETTGMFPIAQAQSLPLQAALAGALLDKRLSTARAFPRSVARFKAEAKSLLAEDLETARAAEYAKPVGGGMVRGASVRLAELAAMCWGNLEVEVSSVEVGEKQVTVRAIAWDLQRNYRQEAVAVTTIVDKGGRRYKDSMVETAILATASKAKRNAILSVIPRAFINDLLGHARAVARGEEKPLEQLRQESLDYFARAYRVQVEQVCAMLGVAGPEDITEEQIDTLRAIANSLKSGEATPEEFFPPPAPQDRLERLRRATNREPEPTPATGARTGRRRQVETPDSGAIPQSDTNGNAVE